MCTYVCPAGTYTSIIGGCGQNFAARFARGHFAPPFLKILATCLLSIENVKINLRFTSGTDGLNEEL